MMTEEGKLLYDEAILASRDLDSKLADISIRIPATDEKIIESFVAVYGISSLLDDGSARLTYPMYKSLVSMIRDLGTLTANEVLS